MLSKPRRSDQGPRVAPGGELDDHQPGVARGQVGRCQAEALEGAGPVAEQRRRRRRRAAPRALAAGGRGEVEEGAALAEQGVEGSARRQVGTLRRVEPQHLGAERAEEAGADRPGDDPGEVEDPHPGRRRRRPAGRDGGRALPRPGAVEALGGDQRLGRHGPPAGAPAHSSALRTAAATPPWAKTRSSNSAAPKHEIASSTVSARSSASASFTPAARSSASRCQGKLAWVRTQPSAAAQKRDSGANPPRSRDPRARSSARCAPPPAPDRLEAGDRRRPSPALVQRSGGHQRRPTQAMATSSTGSRDASRVSTCLDREKLVRPAGTDRHQRRLERHLLIAAVSFPSRFVLGPVSATGITRRRSMASKSRGLHVRMGSSLATAIAAINASIPAPLASAHLTSGSPPWRRTSVPPPRRKGTARSPPRPAGQRPGASPALSGSAATRGPTVRSASVTVVIIGSSGRPPDR